MSKRWGIHSLIFDLDDTLYPESEFVMSGFQAVDAWLERECRVAGFSRLAVEQFRTGRRGRIFDEVLPQLGLSPEPQLVAALVTVYREHRPVLHLFPDAIATLAWAERIFRLGVLTDGFAQVQRNKLAALGLEPRLKACIVTDELGREFWKPHPKGFEQIMEVLPGNSSGFLYIGDNPRKDFIAPSQLGWHTIRIIRESGEHALHVAESGEQAEMEIHNLTELQNLVEPATKAL
jgi:putative hydrolase of the HAD superfamily